MTSIERMRSILAGKRPDRPAFSFWHHFPAQQMAGDNAVQAHVQQWQTHGVDFIKVMNDNPYPHEGAIRSVEELGALPELRGDERGFGRQLELIAKLRQWAGPDVMLCTTIFNAWTVLRNLVEPPQEHRPPVMRLEDQPSEWIRDALSRDARAVGLAMEAIAGSLANFAQRCIAAGADGIYLSVRQEWVEPTPAEYGLYDRLVRPTDWRILNAAGDAELNILHVCGMPHNLRAFNDYPVAAMSWADRIAGPDIREAATWMRPTPCAGVDNLRTLCDGSPEQVQEEVRDALHQAGQRPMIVAPGCTFDPRRVPPENLHAIGQAVKAWKY